MRGLVVVALVTALSACSKTEETPPPDAERIQKVAQALLAAQDKKSAKQKRESAHKSWRGVTEALRAFRTSLVTGSTAKTQDNPRQRDQGIQQVLSALDAVRKDREKGVRKSEAEVLSHEALSEGVLAKIDSLRTEIQSWKGKPAAEQLQAATQMLARIEIRPAYVPQQGGETPSVSTLTEHR